MKYVLNRFTCNSWKSNHICTAFASLDGVWLDFGSWKFLSDLSFFRLVSMVFDHGRKMQKEIFKTSS